jgi:hypothetical protein
MRDLIRRAIIARMGHRLIEVDVKGIEVSIAHCYHQDPVMESYIRDPSKDMHRDMALEIYKLTREELGDTKARPGKDVRYCAKNKFVFPEFYGSWWLECAVNLWNAIDQMNLTTANGTPLHDHLRKKGIKGLGSQSRKNPTPEPGSFGAHLKKIEAHFWGERFPVYAQWKEDWFRAYVRRGWFKTKTGFICQGYMGRNDAINYPVQGAAFHCVLWVLIQLVNVELRKAGLRALPVGQVHDNIISDVPDHEVEEYVALVRYLMIEKLPQVWSWITVPLEVEVEQSDIHGPWSEMKGLK